jgi:hypothetical protein
MDNKQKGNAGAAPATKTETKTQNSATPAAVKATEPSSPLKVVEDKPQAEQPKKPTILQIIEKNEKQNLLLVKREKLVGTKSNLENFRLVADESVKLNFRDSAGHEFSTSNPVIIEKIHEVIKQHVEVLISENDSQLLQVEMM